MTQCTNIDASLLEKTKVDKLLQRILKRSDEEGKALARKVFENAKSGSEKPATTAQINGFSKQPTEGVNRLSDNEIAKKERTVDAKKTSAEPVSKSVNPSTQPKAKPAADVKSISKTPSDAGDTKQKVVNVAAKPSAFFSSLKSASKRPGTSSKAEDSNPK